MRVQGYQKSKGRVCSQGLLQDAQLLALSVYVSAINLCALLIFYMILFHAYSIEAPVAAPQPPLNRISAATALEVL